MTVILGAPGGILPEVFSRDGVQFLRHSTVDAGLSSFPRRFQKYGQDGEQQHHESRVSGQVRVHRPRMD